MRPIGHIYLWPPYKIWVCSWPIFSSDPWFASQADLWLGPVLASPSTHSAWTGDTSLASLCAHVLKAGVVSLSELNEGLSSRFAGCAFSRLPFTPELVSASLLTLFDGSVATACQGMSSSRTENWRDLWSDVHFQREARLERGTNLSLIAGSVRIIQLATKPY